VRLPASFCGVWGIRTSFGQISLDGAMPFTHSFDTTGWFARSPRIMARVAQAFDLPTGVAPTRLLLPVDVWARASAATVAALAPLLARLQQNFCLAEPVILSPEGLDHWRETFRICQAYEIWDVHGDWVQANTPDFGPGIKERFEIASQISDADFTRESARKHEIRAHIEALLPLDTVMVVPTSPGPAPLRAEPESALNDFRMRAFEMLCTAGLAGLPQLSIPAGLVEGGPVGLSLLGARGQDRQLIELAARLDVDT
jgi:amidase